MARPSRPLEQRFLEKVVRDPSGCWLWTGAKGRARNHGYGYIKLPYQAGVRTRCERTHRLSWLLYRGPIPAGQHVLHRCDNPPCCNPDHLFLGTQADNARDMVSKGRHVFGERSPHAKLTVAKVRAIRAERAAGVSYAVLAETYGVARQNLDLIVRGQSWAHA